MVYWTYSKFLNLLYQSVTYSYQLVAYTVSVSDLHCKLVTYTVSY